MTFKTRYAKIIFLYLSYRNPTHFYIRPDKTKKSCMSKGGIPIQPFFALGGFIPEGIKGFPKDPEYQKATAVVVTFIGNNYDAKSRDPIVKKHLEDAMEWEKVYVEFMKNWTSIETNTRYMDVAFNSERSIGDELERETYGDIVTIALSYIFMFVYITFALGRITKWSKFMVTN